MQYAIFLQLHRYGFMKTVIAVSSQSKTGNLIDFSNYSTHNS